MNNLGTLTRKQFNDEITKFTKKSEVLNENWSTRQMENAPDCRYLVKRQAVGLYKDVNYLQSQLETENFEGCSSDAEFDSTIYANDVEAYREMVTFEYHVVYSPSYSVPVLYFSAWTQDGKRLSLNDIWDQVSQVHQHFLHHDKWSFITQQEHPLLQQPFFLVHPCHTADFMKLLNSNSSSVSDHSLGYIIPWLSAVGPTVGLHLPIEFGFDKQITHKGKAE